MRQYWTHSAYVIGKGNLILLATLPNYRVIKFKVKKTTYYKIQSKKRQPNTMVVAPLWVTLYGIKSTQKFGNVVIVMIIYVARIIDPATTVKLVLSSWGK